LGTVLGLNNFLAIAVIIIARITFVIEDSTEAPICNKFVIKTFAEILEQAFSMTEFVYISDKKLLQ